MENTSPFCTCNNLRLKEIPSCFFNLIQNAEERNGDSFEDFAQMIINHKND